VAATLGNHPSSFTGQVNDVCISSDCVSEDCISHDRVGTDEEMTVSVLITQLVAAAAASAGSDVGTWPFSTRSRACRYVHHFCNTTSKLCRNFWLSLCPQIFHTFAAVVSILTYDPLHNLQHPSNSPAASFWCFHWHVITFTGFTKFTSQ
jgi:hypothetical protein